MDLNPNVATSAALEPLFRPPHACECEADYRKPRCFSAADALHLLCEDGRVKHSDAEYAVKQCRHRLALPRHFAPEQLEEERRELQRETVVMEQFAFYERCWFGFPLQVWPFHQDTLTLLLEEAKAGEEGWRFEEVTIGNLLAAIVEVGTEH